VGFDRNNPEAGQYLYFKSSQDWVLLDTVSPVAFKGAVMLRPVLGDIAPVNTPNPVEDVAAAAGLRAFPNPTTGALFLESELFPLAEFRAELYDATGRQQGAWESLPQQLSLAEHPPGSYILQIIHKNSGLRTPLRIIRVD
jgi:hypothetical protein